MTPDTTTPSETTEETPAAEAAETEAKPNREARYRVERNEAREQVTALTARIEQLQQREVEQIAAAHLSAPADLLTLGGVTLADLLDDDGNVDADKVTAVAADVLGTRPGLRPNQPAIDPSQGSGGNPGKSTPTWGSLLR